MNLARPISILALALVAASCASADPSQSSSDDPGASEDALAMSKIIPRLMAIASHCTPASHGKLEAEVGKPATIDVCRLKGAFFWKSRMNVDCDGQTTPECCLQKDPDYQNQTSFTQSDDKPLIAAKLPYIVIPERSARFDYVKEGIEPGALAVVIYRGKVVYGVFGDEGPPTAIGEASYAMAKALGINPDPRNGGVEDGVTYFVFSGKDGVVDPIESHDAAVRKGTLLVQQLLQQ